MIKNNFELYLYGFIMFLIIIITLLLFYVKNENAKLFKPANYESLSNNIK